MNQAYSTAPRVRMGPQKSRTLIAVVALWVTGISYVSIHSQCWGWLWGLPSYQMHFQKVCLRCKESCCAATVQCSH